MLFASYFAPNDPKNHGRVIAVDPAAGWYRYPQPWEVNMIRNEVSDGRARINPIGEPEWTNTFGKLTLRP